jgi:hypothetical protein
MFSDISEEFTARRTLSLIALIFVALSPPPALAQSDDERQKTHPTSIAPQKMSPEESCNKLYNRFITALQDLWKRRALELKAENTDGYALVEDFTIDHCKEADSRGPMISMLARILNTHSGKIGVILPLSRQPHLRIMTDAFEAHARAQGLDPKKTFIYFDTNEKDDKVTQGLASFVFEHRVTSIIGGSEPREAEILRQWAPKIMVPTFIIGEPPNSPPSNFIYYAHPTQKALAKAAVDANVRFGHKKISILSPSDQHSDRFIAAYTDLAKAAGLNILHHVSYDHKRFDLMESAAKKIFRLDGSDRKDELKKLYETAKQHAKDTNTKFNPKMVALQADVQQDVVLIPDTFKIVRYFAKIFAFLGVRKLPLFGHFEWRSPGLINPWDSFMTNSYFVDFQGPYSGMPDAIKVQTSDSPFFLPNDKVEHADFAMLGWRASAAPLFLAQKRSDPRRKLDRQIPRKQSQPTDIAFDSNNVVVWPTYIFKISGTGKAGNISLVNP